MGDLAQQLMEWGVRVKSIYHFLNSHNLLLECTNTKEEMILFKFIFDFL